MSDSNFKHGPLGFIKVCTEREHAEDFIRGRLFMRTLGYFKKLEEDEVTYRGDGFEAVSSVIQPNQIGKLRLGPVEIEPHQLVGPLLVHNREPLSWHVFCLYSVTTVGFDGPLTSETAPILENAMRLPAECFGLGSFAVYIRSVDEFKARLCAAVKQLNVDGAIGSVQYCDEDSFTENIEPLRVPFRKRKKFSFQKEFRLVLNIPSAPDPYFFDIGDISDIAILTTPEEFNSMLEIRLPG